MFHLINCFLLTFAPYFVIYRASKLKEERSLPALFTLSFLYCSTQAIKFFLVATLLPTTNTSATTTAITNINITHHIFLLVTSLIDLLGLRYIFISTSSITRSLSRFDTNTRLLLITLGWSFTSSLLHYGVPLYVIGRELEFSWSGITMGVCANIEGLMWYAVVIAMYLTSRNNIPVKVIPLVGAVLVIFIGWNSLQEILFNCIGSSEMSKSGNWELLKLKLLVVVVMNLLAYLGMYHYLRSVQVFNSTHSSDKQSRSKKRK